MDLVEILAELVRDDGLAVAMIVGRDGMLVEGQIRGSSTDMEKLAAMATRSLTEMERVGRQVSGGNLSQIRLRFDNYLLLIEMLSPADILVVGIHGNNSEQLLDAVARHRQQIQQALSGL